jgi:hypothetical protein
MFQVKSLCKVTKMCCTALLAKIFGRLPVDPNFAPGEMAERSIAAVLKTVEGHTSGGSNPSLSARSNVAPQLRGIFYARKERSEANFTKKIAQVKTCAYICKK